MKKKRKSKCSNNCDLALPAFCWDCNAMCFHFRNGQEIEDILSALSFFISDYDKPAPQTKKAMKKIINKIWKTKDAIKGLEK